MKFTFVSVDGEPWAECHDCGQMPIAPFWWNWRRQATVKVLCESCYARRADADIAQRATYMLNGRRTA